MKTKNILIYCAFLLIGYLTYTKMQSGDEKQILNLIQSIQEQTHFDQPVSKVGIVSRIGNIKPFLSKNIELEAFDGAKSLVSTNSFDDIKAGAFIGAKYLAKHKTYVTETSVEVIDNSASAELILVSEGSERDKTNKFRELFTVTLELTKTEEAQWVINKVTADRQTEKN